MNTLTTPFRAFGALYEGKEREEAEELAVTISARIAPIPTASI